MPEPLTHGRLYLTQAKLYYDIHDSSSDMEIGQR